MQPKNKTFYDFSTRTDELAAFLNITLNDLPDRIGIARGSMFAYRSGKSPISHKTWLKLERAEREAGISTQKDQLAQGTISEQPRASPDPWEIIAHQSDLIAKQSEALSRQTEVLQKMLETMERLEGRKMGEPTKELRRRAS